MWVPRRRLLLLCASVGIAGTAALTPATAAADPAAPGNFLTRVLSITPATPTIHPTVEGGDSFMLLKVDAGTTVEVPGYQDEPFLRFDADGTVYENSVSYTASVSDTRYVTETPTDTSGLEPQWRKVGDGGSYAWHDHRIHWMSPNNPPGRAPGDVILRADVLLVVDGVDVVVRVESVWMPAPSPAATWIGGALGAALAATAFALRRTFWAGYLVVDLATLALVVGWWQYSSLPGETGPRLTWALLPAIALVATAGATVARRRSGATAVLAAHALILLAGLNLLLWGWDRRDGLSASVLPTDAPFWLDRAASAAALVGGAVMTGGALVLLARVIAEPGTGALDTAGLDTAGQGDISSAS